MLKLESVDVAYGQIQALTGISIDVRDGELVTLLGANGAGKSTTLMAISGIVRPRAGTITYGGVDLAKESAYDIVGLGVIQCPEGRRIFGGLTVLENLKMGSMRRATKAGVPRDIEWVFSLFPILAQRRHQSGATLSGGEQQMLAMGRALMAEPRLLMLDEPSLGLAPLVVRAIFQVIRELHRRGVTILLVEQNVRQALAVADRGYVLSTGKVLLEGAGRDLRSNPEIERAYLSTASGTRE
ncbi:MAG: ABC transporter ATP-binding protein [Rectinemataceae bacterium]|jgi:branched-chain amino acid transport system ATP-binding protein